MDNFSYRPARSVLYVPGSNSRALEKAPGLPADAIVFDLEDAVAPDAKAEARDNVIAAIASGNFADKRTIVRINDRESPFYADDVRAAAKSGAEAVLLPKVTGQADILALSADLDLAAAPDDIALWAMIEMPRAVIDIVAISELAETTELKGFVLGFNDLVKEMGARGDTGRPDLWNPVRMQIALAARAYGLTLIDSVYNDFRDSDGLAAECATAAAMGFDGKSLIHPGQVEIANRAFSPSEEEIAEAHKIVAAFDDPANAGKGAIQIDGAMVELLHAEQARRTLAIAAAMSASPS